jgi:hypothetical protein
MEKWERRRWSCLLSVSATPYKVRIAMFHVEHSSLQKTMTAQCSTWNTRDDPGVSVET